MAAFLNLLRAQREAVNLGSLFTGVEPWPECGGALYQVSAQVSSQAPEARAQAASKAQDMLWRLTGSQQAAQNPALASVLSRAETDADSFSYTGNEQITFSFSPKASTNSLKNTACPTGRLTALKVLVWSLLDGQWPGPTTAAWRN